jgi:hypothetical protein
MFRLGGMPADELQGTHEKMSHYFAKVSNKESNAILKVVEQRLAGTGFL